MKQTTPQQRVSQMIAKTALIIFLIAAAVAGNSAKKVKTPVTEAPTTVEVMI